MRKEAILMKTPQVYDREPPTMEGHQEHQPPVSTFAQNRKRPIGVTVALSFIAALVGGVSVFAWQRLEVRDQERSLEEAVEARDDAITMAATLSDRVDRLQGRLTTATTRSTELAADVASLEARLLAMVGPALPDGKHFGRLYAVGANQEPPRLVIDIEQWFTDQEAVEAAIEDGITVDPGINGYYIRNENPRWRTIAIDSAAKVSLTTYPFADPSDPTVVSLNRFGELFSSYEGRSLQLSPYWITVQDGKIAAIEEQFIP
jgi:hypothetical protein